MSKYLSNGLYHTGSVPGQSSVNFIFNLMELHEGVHGGYSLKEGRPLIGETLLTASPPLSWEPNIPSTKWTVLVCVQTGWWV